MYMLGGGFVWSLESISFCQDFDTVKLCCHHKVKITFKVVTITGYIAKYLI